MTESYNRLKRMQQRVWRKAANALLMLKQHVTISLSFLVIIVFGVFWIVFEQSLQDHLFDNARNYGYGVAQYASADLGIMLQENRQDDQKTYLNRLVSTPLIVSATLYDKAGLLVAEASSNSEFQIDNSKLVTLLHDVKLADNRIGMLKITLNRQAQEAPIQEFMNGLAFMAVALMILASIASWYLARYLTRPINRLFSLPLEAPDTKAVESLDVADEIKGILQRSGQLSNSPAPISEMESAGIHKLLAVDAQASKRSVVILKIKLYQMKQWYQSHSDSEIVRKLRAIDQRLLVAVHGQTGMLLHFDGISAKACFGMSTEVTSPEYKALSCALLIKDLLADIGVAVQLLIRAEDRIILQHRHRMPIAVPFDKKLYHSKERPFAEICIHQNIADILSETGQLSLSNLSPDWYTLESMTDSAQSLYQRQKDWTEYLLGNEI